MAILWKEIENHAGFYASSTGLIMRPNKKITPGYKNTTGYYYISINKQMLRVSRLIAQTFLENPDDKPFVDHISRNRQDNSVENLRWVTASENSRNMSSHAEGSSPYIGVAWHKASAKWQVQIFVDGKNRHIGLFTDETAAAVAYDKVAAENGFLTRNFSSATTN